MITTFYTRALSNQTLRLVLKNFIKEAFWEWSVYLQHAPTLPLYPIAATQAVEASSLFIATRLHTGPACLSQDPAASD